MLERNVTGIPIVDNNIRFLAIVTERNLLSSLFTKL